MKGRTSLRVVGAFATTALSVAAALAQGPAALAAEVSQPTGKWSVDYEQSMCVLSHDFGTGSDRVTLGLRPFPLSGRTEIVLLQPPGGERPSQGSASVRLLPAGTILAGTYQISPLRQPPGSLLTISTDADPQVLLGEEKQMVIDLGSGRRWTLAMPPAAGARAALAACQGDLLTSWKVDSTERARQSRPPVRVPGPLGSDDYPAAALQARAQGTTVTVLTITSEGHVGDCRVVVSAGNSDLDTVSCKVASRSRYTPALSLTGTPVESHVVVPVKWVLPTR